PCGQTFRAPATEPKPGHTPEDLLADLARRSTPPPKAEKPRIAPTAPPPPSQSKSAPAPATIPHIRPAAYREETKASQLKTILLIGLGLALLLATILTISIISRRPTKPTTPALGEDARVTELIDQYGRPEARDWLAPNTR